ncbi:hypothetical protein BGC07_10865 [Piscirickettsia litoralis]|uniref:peptidoglycan lytic exotransglycosylase n=2 Tax=Piscirickettsia litoralis TaxID=1891921 RepID=A0ABX3A3B9_9GAMM|nr:hypothetical protein BGC07_10865 [Piscirickettsia litoralis]
MQIQGSSILAFNNGKKQLIGYAGQNSQPYYAIGRVLLKKGALTRENISMQTIQNWLKNHPKQQQAILDLNKSFVFFKPLNHQSPLGTQQVPLTANTSLAIDLRHIPLGSLVWLQLDNTPKIKPHGWVAQDTGGAIKGLVRADLYLGAGKYAEQEAGKLNSTGQLWLLLPKTINISQFQNKLLLSRART